MICSHQLASDCDAQNAQKIIPKFHDIMSTNVFIFSKTFSINYYTNLGYQTQTLDDSIHVR